MQENDISVDTRRILKIRMKGLWIPTGCLSLLGWIHNKKGFIVADGMTSKSPWLSKQMKYFNSYMAAVYREMANVLKPLYVEMEQTNDSLRNICMKMTENRKEMTKAPTDTIREKRRCAAAKKQFLLQEKKQEEMEKRLKEIKLNIDTCEHMVNQMLQEKRQKTESHMLSYLQGARRQVYSDTLLTVDKTSAELYCTLTGKFGCNIETKGNDREVDAV